MEKAEQIISELFGIKIPKDGSPLSRILADWKNITVDGRLADHCRLEDLSGNRLTVSFDHQGWMQVFKMHQRQILKNLNRYLPQGELTAVRMIMKGDKEAYRKEPEPPRPQRERPREKQEFPSEGIGEIRDEDLKNRLENLRKKLQGN